MRSGRVHYIFKTNAPHGALFLIWFNKGRINYQLIYRGLLLISKRYHYILRTISGVYGSIYLLYLSDGRGNSIHGHNFPPFPKKKKKNESTYSSQKSVHNKRITDHKAQSSGPQCAGAGHNQQAHGSQCTGTGHNEQAHRLQCIGAGHSVQPHGPQCSGVGHNEQSHGPKMNRCEPQ